METQKIIHIAAEVVLLGAVTFYFNGQIKGLKNEMNDLKSKIKEQDESMNKHLNSLYSIIDKLNADKKQLSQDINNLQGRFRSNNGFDSVNAMKVRSDTFKPKQLSFEDEESDEDEDYQHVNLRNRLSRKVSDNINTSSGELLNRQNSQNHMQLHPNTGVNQSNQNTKLKHPEQQRVQSSHVYQHHRPPNQRQELLHQSSQNQFNQHSNQVSHQMHSNQVSHSVKTLPPNIHPSHMDRNVENKQENKQEYKQENNQDNKLIQEKSKLDEELNDELQELQNEEENIKLKANNDNIDTLKKS